MNTLILGLILLGPTIAFIALCLWIMFRRTPLERCKILFRSIALHPNHDPRLLPKFLAAVRDQDLAWLERYLKSLGPANSQRAGDS